MLFSNNRQLPSLLRDSTVGYPSDSLASCSSMIKQRTINKTRGSFRFISHDCFDFMFVARFFLSCAQFTQSCVKLYVLLYTIFTFSRFKHNRHHIWSPAASSERHPVTANLLTKVVYPTEAHVQDWWSVHWSEDDINKLPIVLYTLSQSWCYFLQYLAN